MFTPRHAPAFAVTSLSYLVAAGCLAAQSPTFSIRGTVRDGTGMPIEGVQLSIRGADARVESGEDGRYALLKVPRAPGDTIWLRARRIGYRADSVPLAAAMAADPTTDANVPIVLERIAVTLQPLRVTSRRVLVGPMAGFERRRTSGNGRFFTAAEIDRKNPSRLTDLLRFVPGMRLSAARTAPTTVRMRGARCAPLVWLDGQPLGGMEFDLDGVNPRSVEGIEVYSGPASVPIEFQRDRFGSSSCGTIVLWTRRGERRAPTPKPDAAVATRLTELVESQQLFTDRDVDTPARIDSTEIVRPAYPDSLFTAGVAGRVLAEFVVRANGEVQIETFNVVGATNREFVAAVRDAVRDQRFIPAMRRGVAVAQVVQQPFEFVTERGGKRSP